MSVNGFAMSRTRIFKGESSNYMLRKPLSFYGMICFAIILMVVSVLFSTILMLRWINPPATAFTIQEDWSEFEVDRYSLRDYWVDREDLPEHLKWAVTAAEDQRFYEHQGFDFEAINEAWEDHNQGIRSRGASTISQQVAKNLFLWPGHSWIRKGLEAGITVMIELVWPKDRILEVYLNIAEFGPGLFGVGKSTQQMFGMPVNELTPEESARLAVVLPNPKRMRAEPPTPFVEERSRWILNQMTHLTGTQYYEPEEEEPEEVPDFKTEDPLPPGFHRTWEVVSDTTTPADTVLTLPDSLRPSPEPISVPADTVSQN